VLLLGERLGACGYVVSRVQYSIVTVRMVTQYSVVTHTVWDLIEKLLNPDPAQRLGAQGAWELKSNPFLAGIRWGDAGGRRGKRRGHSCLPRHWGNLCSAPAPEQRFQPVPDGVHDTSYFATRASRPDDTHNTSGTSSCVTVSTLSPFASAGCFHSQPRRRPRHFLPLRRGAAAWEGAGAGMEGQAEDYESSDACSSTSADYYEEVSVTVRGGRCHFVQQDVCRLRRGAGSGRRDHCMRGKVSL